MSKTTGAPIISSLADLFAAAYQIEADAAERYELLATQMETHNNPELASLFRDLARAEGIHRDEIRRLADPIDVDVLTQRRFTWGRDESPEDADLGAVHYLMKPWHALQLALTAEKRALAFFTSIAGTTRDPKVKAMADEFVEEEAEHVNLVYRLLGKYPEPPEQWAQDPDSPVAQD